MLYNAFLTELRRRGIKRAKYQALGSMTTKVIMPSYQTRRLLYRKQVSLAARSAMNALAMITWEKCLPFLGNPEHLYVITFNTQTYRIHISEPLNPHGVRLQGGLLSGHPYIIPVPAGASSVLTSLFDVVGKPVERPKRTVNYRRGRV